MKVKDICVLQNGRAFKPEEWGTEGLPIVRIQNLNDPEAPFNYYAGTYSPVHEINNGELLFSWSGTPGTSFGAFRWYRGKGLLNQHIFRVLPKIEVDKDYLKYALNGNIGAIIAKAHGGVGLQHITKRELEQIEIPIISLKEQLKIVEEISSVEKVISLRQQQLAKLDELVKARFAEMFGDPMINSMHWPIYELSEYIQFLTSGSRGWAKYFTDEGEYFITIKNVKNCKITLDDVQHIAPPDNAEAKRTKVQAGDLLISITADLGRTGVVTQEIAEHGAYINQHLTCIRLNQSVVLPLYVAYYMESDAGKKQFQLKNQTGVKAGLNFNSINTLKVMVPPLEKQRSFVSFVEQVEKTKSSIQKNLKKIEILKKALVQRYFG